MSLKLLARTGTYVRVRTSNARGPLELRAPECALARPSYASVLLLYCTVALVMPHGPWVLLFRFRTIPYSSLRYRLLLYECFWVCHSQTASRTYGLNYCTWVPTYVLSLLLITVLQAYTRGEVRVQYMHTAQLHGTAPAYVPT